MRPKYSCSACQKIVQANAPSRPIERSYAGPGLLAHVLVSKYCDHLPFYRQSQIYARDGVELDRSTLADWGGAASALLDPLLGALDDYVMAAHKLHADDTPIPVLAPGTGKTKSGRLWAYCAMIGPPAVPILRRCCFAIPRIARVSGLASTCSTFAASCRPMPMEDSTAYTIERTSR